MHTKLKISKERVRSLMDLDMPAEYAPDMEVPLPSVFTDKNYGSDSSKNGKVSISFEPYFESGQDDWAAHAKVLQKAMVGVEFEGDGDELLEVDGGGEILDVERLLLEGAFDDIDDNDENLSNEVGTNSLSMISNSNSNSNSKNTILYSVGGVGPFAGELGDYEELLSVPKNSQVRTFSLQPLEIKESFLGQAKPRSAREGGLNPNSSNNPTERKKKGNRGQGQIIKEGENSALSGKRRSKKSGEASVKTKSSGRGVSGATNNVKGNSNSKPKDVKGSRS